MFKNYIIIFNKSDFLNLGEKLEICEFCLNCEMKFKNNFFSFFWVTTLADPNPVSPWRVIETFLFIKPSQEPQNPKILRTGF